MTILAVALISGQALAGEERASDYASGEFSLTGTIEKSADFLRPEAASQVWSVRMSSDGVRAWGVVHVDVPPPVYAAPTKGGKADYTRNGDFLVWRDVAYAVEYDLISGLTSVCHVVRLHVLAPDGRTRVNDPVGQKSMTWLDKEMLWFGVWGALGDHTTQAHLYKGVQGPPFRDGIPLATRNVKAGSPPKTVVLHSFETVEDSSLASVAQEVFRTYCD